MLWEVNNVCITVWNWALLLRSLSFFLCFFVFLNFLFPYPLLANLPHCFIFFLLSTFLLRSIVLFVIAFFPVSVIFFLCPIFFLAIACFSVSVIVFPCPIFSSPLLASQLVTSPSIPFPTLKLLTFPSVPFSPSISLPSSTYISSLSGLSKGRLPLPSWFSRTL